MTFIRSSAGINNYNLFYNVDLVVFIEGQESTTHEGEVPCADEIFYSALTSSILPTSKIKIKCVGNCKDVLTCTSKIDKDNNSYVGVIDRDADGVLYCLVNTENKIILTNGYSWENDLWSKKTINNVLKNLGITLSNKELSNQAWKKILAGSKRLRFLSRLDFSHRVHGSALFKKNKNSCGIKIDGNSKSAIPKSEIRRLILKYKDSNALNDFLSKEILEITKKLPNNKLIQGHLLLSLICNIISAAYDNQRSKLPHHVIQSVGLAAFQDNPSECLDRKVYDYYKDSFTKVYSLAKRQTT